MYVVSGDVHCSTSCKHVYVGEALKKSLGMSGDTSIERMINTKTKEEVRDKTAEYSLEMNSC